MFGFIPERRKASNSKVGKIKLLQRIKVVKGDLTKQYDLDAIVSCIPNDLAMSGTLNESLVRAAGAEFDDFILDNVFKPKPGDCFVTPGFNLDVKYVIFVVTPPLKDKFEQEDIHLLRCYRVAMAKATEMGMSKIAFPVLGTGKGRYPLDRAVRLAIRGIMDRITPDFAEVRIVCKEPHKFDAFVHRLEKYGPVKKGA